MQYTYKVSERQKIHTFIMKLEKKLSEIIHGTIQWVYAGEIGNIPSKIFHGRFKYIWEEYGIYTKIDEMVNML